MPWLNTPQDRQTTFIEPLYPRGGLLGGSGAPPKMSKLQQLAAARKKKAEEQKAAEKSKENVPKTPNTSATKQMSKLSVNSKESSKDAELAPAPTGFPPGPSAPTIPQSEADASRSDNLTQLDGPADRPGSQPEPGSHNESPAVEPAAPSDFAQALLGPAQLPASVLQTSYALPYMAFTSSVSDAFSGPSPDDVVLTAQAKGSLSGSRKV
jgi:elongation factor 1 alpha-like protein